MKRLIKTMLATTTVAVFGAAIALCLTALTVLFVGLLGFWVATKLAEV